jgi:hypothetical protein
MPRVAGPFEKSFREYEQPWHIDRFDTVRRAILALEPSILDDKAIAEQVRTPRAWCKIFSIASTQLFADALARAWDSKLSAKEALRHACARRQACARTGAWRKHCSTQVLEHLHGCSRHGAFDLLLNLYVCN